VNKNGLKAVGLFWLLAVGSLSYGFAIIFFVNYFNSSIPAVIGILLPILVIVNMAIYDAGSESKDTL